MVELDCGRTCMKYILFIINFIFFLLGAAALGIGVWAYVDKNKMTVLAKVGADNTDFNVVGLLDSAVIVLLVGGAAILLIGFLGCCGAYKENQYLLGLYVIFLGIVVLVEIGAVVIAAIFKGQVQDKVESFIKEHINTTYEGRISTSEEFSLGLDYAQVNFHCCGVDNFTEFEDATKWNKTTASGAEMVIPPSCCKLKDEYAYYKEPKDAKLEDENCPVSPTNENSYMTKACWTSIEDWLDIRIYAVIGKACGILTLGLQSSTNIFPVVCLQACWTSIEDWLNIRIYAVIGIACGILALEVFCIIFAACIICAIRKDL